MPDDSEIGRLLAGANDADPVAAVDGDRMVREVVPPAFREFFVHLSVGDGAATLSLRRDRQHPGRVYVGIAWCSPGDQFSRARGRLVAGGRRRTVEQMARGQVNYAGSGFIFAVAGSDKLDKEAVLALGAWLDCRRAEITEAAEAADTNWRDHALRCARGGDRYGIPRWLDLADTLNVAIAPRSTLDRDPSR